MAMTGDIRCGSCGNWGHNCIAGLVASPLPASCSACSEKDATIERLRKERDEAQEEELRTLRYLVLEVKETQALRTTLDTVKEMCLMVRSSLADRITGLIDTTTNEGD